jgi:hypothetical protein
MANELKRDRIRIFRHNSLMTTRVIISSHGGQRQNQQGYNPPGLVFYMEQHFGAPTQGTLQQWTTRYENGALVKAGNQYGAVGDYILTKFQGYHHTGPYVGRKLLHALNIHHAAETYQDIRNFVDDDNHLPIDVVTIRNVSANRNGMYLSDVIQELQAVTRRYNEIIMAFCLVGQGYGGYVNAVTGVPL